jgi:addiction module HigA family antidote
VKLPPPHPGETLLEDFVKPQGLTPSRVAKDLGVHGLTASLLIRGRRAATPELAPRLSRYRHHARLLAGHAGGLRVAPGRTETCTAHGAGGSVVPAYCGGGVSQHLAKDRAAEALTKVMTRQALDYPV